MYTQKKSISGDPLEFLEDSIISAQLTCFFTLWILQIVREQRRGSVIDVFNGFSVGE